MHRSLLLASFSLSLACGGPPPARHAPSPSAPAGFTRLSDATDARFDADFEPPPPRRAAPPPAPTWVRVGAGAATLYAGPTGGGEGCGRLRPNTIARIVGTQGRRLQVELGTGLFIRAWVDRDEVDPGAGTAPPDPNLARTTALTGELPAFGPLITVPAGTLVRCNGVGIARVDGDHAVRPARELEGGMLAIVSGPHDTGYVAGQLDGVTSLRAGGRARVVGSEAVSLYASASEDQVIGSVGSGQVVTVIERVVGWARVHLTGAITTSGYLRPAGLLATDAPLPPAQVVRPGTLVGPTDVGSLVPVRPASRVALAGGAVAHVASGGAYAHVISVDRASRTVDVLLAANDGLILRGRLALADLVLPEPAASATRRPRATRPPPPPPPRVVASRGGAPAAVVRALYSVVRVWCLSQSPSQDGQSQVATGSATVITADGRLLTNFHVVGDHGRLTRPICGVGPLRDPRQPVEPEWAARVVAQDPRSDLAVLQVQGALEGHQLPRRFHPLRVGRDPNIGDRVYVLGFPNGSSTTHLTGGAISGFARDAGGQWVQTDAEINHGNSGGAMIDARGRLVGVPTAFLTVADPVGLARPISEVPRAWLR